MFNFETLKCSKLLQFIKEEKLQKSIWVCSLLSNRGLRSQTSETLLIGRINKLGQSAGNLCRHKLLVVVSYSMAKYSVASYSVVAH